MQALSPSFECSTGHDDIPKEIIVRKFGKVMLQIRTPRTGMALTAIGDVERALEDGNVSDAEEVISEIVKRAEKIGTPLHIGLHYRV